MLSRGMSWRTCLRSAHRPQTDMSPWSCVAASGFVQGPLLCKAGMVTLALPVSNHYR